MRLPSPADGFLLVSSESSSNVSISGDGPGDLRSLEAGGQTHHKTGLPQGATSPLLWGSGETEQTRAAARRGLGRFVSEPSQLLPAAKQTNRKDISPESEEVSDLDCAV